MRGCGCSIRSSEAHEVVDVVPEPHRADAPNAAFTNAWVRREPYRVAIDASWSRSNMPARRQPQVRPVTASERQPLARRDPRRTTRARMAERNAQGQGGLAPITLSSPLACGGVAGPGFVQQLLHKSSGSTRIG